jgi:hypothetical protein
MFPVERVQVDRRIMHSGVDPGSSKRGKHRITLLGHADDVEMIGVLDVGTDGERTRGRQVREGSVVAPGDFLAALNAISQLR